MENQNLETENINDVVEEQTQANPNMETESPAPNLNEDIDAEHNEEQPEKPEPSVPMLTRVNQVVTTLISGVFGSLIILLGVMVFNKLGFDLQTQNNLIQFQSLLIGVLLFSLGLTLSQILDAYLTKLAEKDHFTRVSFKAYKIFLHNWYYFC